MPDRVSLNEKQFIREILSDDERSGGSAFKTYRELVVGSAASVGTWLYYEVVTSLLGWVPGAAGLWLRKQMYPSLFRRAGRNVMFGRNVTIRCGPNIELGDNVFIDDYAYIDGRGAGEERLKLGNNVLVGRNAMVHAKSGALHIGDNASVGSASMVISQGGVYIDAWVSLAGGVKVSGGLFEIKPDAAVDGRPYTRYSKGPIRIGSGTMVASGTTMVDGVSVGRSCMIGPNSTIVSDIPDYCTVSARPPIVMKFRTGSEPGEE